jgi:NAD-dependent SIR2 family protein deacetylase
MSVVFTCTCGRRTTEPFIIGNQKYCTICAEQLRPDIVESRERHNRSKYGTRHRSSPGFDGHDLDFGKHSSR